MNGLVVGQVGTRRHLPAVSLAIVILTAFVGADATCWAQSTADQIHVQPLISTTRQRDAVPALKANVDLALVNVTVTDPDGRIVTDLAPENFSVLDDKRPQTIKYFSCEDAPLSLAIVMDTSSSMEQSFDEVRKAAIEFFQASNPQDELALIAFADVPRVLVDFGDDLNKLEPDLWSLQARGHTALWDALYLAIRQMHRTRYSRRALLIISDGGDNHSRYTESDIKSVLQEADVEVYALDLFKPYLKTSEEKAGLLWLDEITSASGGRVFLIHNRGELHAAVRQISLELRNQYVLGYAVPQGGRDGRWHKLKVNLKSGNKRKLRVYAKRGYYGPVE